MSRAVQKPYAVGIARREQILDAALELFGQQGYRGASIRDVAAEVGLSLAGVLHYFKSKEELLAAVLKHRDDADIPWFYERWEATGNFGVAIRELVRRNLAKPGVMRLFVTLSTESTDPNHPAHVFFRDRYRHSRMIFAEAVGKAAERGELLPGVTGPLLIAVLDGLQVQWLLDPEFDLIAEFEHYLRSITPPPT